MKKGFSLIEMLVAMTITCIILSLLNINVYAISLVV
ncbi:unnamed protein product, partial [marine sediment metagenome]